MLSKFCDDDTDSVPLPACCMLSMEFEVCKNIQLSCLPMQQPALSCSVIQMFTTVCFIMSQYTVKGGIEGPVNAVPLLEAVCNVFD